MSNSCIGKTLRIRRIFKKERAVIVPMDHPVYYGPVQGIEDPRKLVHDIASSGADAILINLGALNIVKDVIGELGIILRLDGTHTELGSHLSKIELVSSVEHAVKIGVDMGAVNVFVGADNESELLRKLGDVVVDCHAWGLPLIGEMIPKSVMESHYARGKKADQETIANDIKLASRVGAEIGADVIKTHYTGSIESFKEVTRTSMVPVVIAGGPKSQDGIKGFLNMVKDSITAGVRGICIGRNVWQYKEPKKLLKALCAIVHEDVEVEKAVKLL